MPNITRIRPVDLLEVQSKYTNLSISAAIAAMQSDAGVTNNCLRCADNAGNATGWIMVGPAKNIQTICPVCSGYLKTVDPFVADPDNPLKSVIFPPIAGNNSVIVGKTLALSNSYPGGTWSSANTATATVNSNGIVTGVAAGTVNILYTFSGKSVTKPVTVTAS